MENLVEFFEKIENVAQREKLRDLFQKILKDFPELETRIAWNQPMFTHHETFIIGFSVSKNHFSVSPEVFCLNRFIEDIKKSGYTYTNNIFRIKWTEHVDVSLIEKMISFNIEDKKDYSKFWR